HTYGARSPCSSSFISCAPASLPFLPSAGAARFRVIAQWMMKKREMSERMKTKTMRTMRTTGCPSTKGTSVPSTGGSTSIGTITTHSGGGGVAELITRRRRMTKNPI
ncbi:hypothetical protein PMAYCL1PPCAC_04008, partial [Pristionchus mayeri]